MATSPTTIDRSDTEPRPSDPRAPLTFQTHTSNFKTRKHWSATSSRPPPHPSSIPIDIITWNVDYANTHPTPRIRAVLSHLSSLLPTPQHTLILLQELSPDALPTILRNQWVRDNFQVSDSSPVSWYFTFSLASLDMPVSAVRRVAYQCTNMDRDVLLLDIQLAGGGVFRVGNTHLESLRHPGVILRPLQLEICSELLKGDGVRAGVVAGDMNAITEVDKTLHLEARLEDVWHLEEGDREEEEGFTWGYQPPCTYPPGRLDKVLYTGAVDWEKVQETRLKRVGVGLDCEVDEEQDRKWASDHYGLWVRARLGGT